MAVGFEKLAIEVPTCPGCASAEYDPALSPDGRSLAFVHSDVPPGSNGVSSVWVADLDGSNVRRISESFIAESPAWSPDGGSSLTSSSTTSAITRTCTSASRTDLATVDTAPPTSTGSHGRRAEKCWPTKRRVRRGASTSFAPTSGRRRSAARAGLPGRPTDERLRSNGAARSLSPMRSVGDKEQSLSASNLPGRPMDKRSRMREPVVARSRESRRFTRAGAPSVA